MQPHPSFQHLNSRSQQPGNSSQEAPQAMTQHLQYVKAMQVKSSCAVVESWLNGFSCFHCQPRIGRMTGM